MLKSLTRFKRELNNLVNVLLLLSNHCTLGGDLLPVLHILKLLFKFNNKNPIDLSQQANT